jgi:hypothetical protein
MLTGGGSAKPVVVKGIADDEFNYAAAIAGGGCRKCGGY